MEYLLYAAIMAATCLVSNSISADIPSPAGRWMFDAASEGKDVSGRGNNAVSSGIDTFPNGPYPGVQGLWRFTGSTSSYAVIPNINQALYSPRGWTFTTWFYNQGGVGPLFEFTASQPDCINWGLHIWMFPESTQFFLNPASGEINIVSPTGSVPLNAWTQLAMTYTFETGVYSTFINGVEITSVRRIGTPQTIHASTSLPSVTIGRRCDSSGALQGAVYCMQWFNETLSVDQLKLAFLICNPNSYPTPLGKWMFDSITGGSDLSGNRNDAVAAILGTVPRGPVTQARGVWRFPGEWNSFASIPNVNQALTVNQSWTFTTWFYNEGGVGPLFEFTSGQFGCNNWGLHIWINPTGTQLFLNPTSGQPYWSSPANAVPLNSWSQLALTYNFDSGVYRMFINGVELATSPFFGTAKFNHATTSLPSVVIGRRRCPTFTGALKGALYCMQWFGTALNAQQLSSAFSACKASVPPSSG